MTSLSAIKIRSTVALGIACLALALAGCQSTRSLLPWGGVAESKPAPPEAQYAAQPITGTTASPIADSRVPANPVSHGYPLALDPLPGQSIFGVPGAGSAVDRPFSSGSGTRSSGGGRC